MATTYSISISLDNETLAALQANGYQLQVFKGVKGPSSGRPTLWSGITTFAPQVKLSWQVQYGGYTDLQTLQNGIVVNASGQRQMELGDTLTLESDGSLSLSTNGMEGAFAIASNQTQEWLCGLTQSMNGAAPSAICAFPLFGQQTDYMEPYETVALVFASGQIDTGTVVEEAESSFCLVTLSGSNTSIGLSFDINKGWDTNGNPAAAVFQNSVSLASKLIVPRP